jgi:hypothetical protein
VTFELISCRRNRIRPTRAVYFDLRAHVDVTARGWRGYVAHSGDPNRRAKGVRSPSWRSLALFENPLDTLEEIVGVRGAYAVPQLVQPTGGH